MTYDGPPPEYNLSEGKIEIPLYRDYVEWLPHDRWSRMMMHIEEDWESIRGVKHAYRVEFHATSYTTGGYVNLPSASSNTITFSFANTEDDSYIVWGSNT